MFFGGHDTVERVFLTSMLCELIKKRRVMSGTSLKPDFIYIAVFQLRTYISANAIPSSSYRYMRLPSMVI